MGFQIPKKFLKGFKVLNNLSPDTAEKISFYISTIPIGTGPKQFKSLINSEFQIENIDKVSTTIYSLGNLLLNNENSLEDLANELAIAYLEELEEGHESGIEVLQQNLYNIFKGATNLKFTFKALNLVSDNHLIYRDSRIVSDIRLIFDENVETFERKGLIIHRLKIEADENYENKNFYFSLDINDLREMQKLINRAIEKEEQIKTDYATIEMIDFTL